LVSTAADDPAIRSLMELYPNAPVLSEVVHFPQDNAPADWQAIGEIELSFSTALLGSGVLAESACPPGDLAVLDSLDALARGGQDPDLPRLPRVLPQLMSLTRREEVGAREISETLAHDPALVGEVLHLANSPLYRGHQELTRLDDAVARLGQLGIRQLVTQVAMRPIFNRGAGRFSSQAGTKLWALSERCAHAATYLNAGEVERACDPFNAYLAGLMAHVGTMASLRVLDQAGAPSRGPLSLKSTGFHRSYLAANALLSARLATHWGLPPEVCEALQRRGEALRECVSGRSALRGVRAAAFPPLAAALCVADRASQMHLLGDSASDAATVTGQGPGTVALGRCLHELQRAFGGR
jgi:HD-like signal output (HDOD) protein